MSRRLATNCTLILAVFLVGISFLRPSGRLEAASVEVGYRDFSFAASGVSAPTGQKPQSKLWHNDGSWWGALFSQSSDAYTIWELDWSTQEWSDTGIVLETRNSARLDALFDGTSLYLVSALTSSNASTPTEVRRFSYSATTRTYSLDSGFPVAVVAGGMEAAVIEKDSTGALWMTYTRSGSVYVIHTTVDDQTWTAPFVIPTAGSGNLQSEDIASIIAFDGQIGVMWSNQNDDRMYLAQHADGDPDSSWTLNPATQLPEYADDHINLKSLQTGPDGRVFAATKTSLNGASDPLILLLVLDQGSWSTYTFATVSEQHTRPMVLIDAENERVYVFASAPCCSGGSIYYKDAPLSAISFPPGLGTPFIQSSTDPSVNNIASTKQSLNSQTGLLAIAGDDSTKFYLHNVLSLGPDTTPPNTVLDSTPGDPSGANDAVFEFSANEGGSTFECQLDGTGWQSCTSPQAYPTIVVGPHLFEVRATDAAGLTDPTPAAYSWTVVPEATSTFIASADTFTDQAVPSGNFGGLSFVEVDGNTGAAQEGLLRFDVAGLPGTVTSATLRIFVTGATVNGPTVATSDPAWDELTTAWNTRPPITGPVVANADAIPSGAWYEFDVSAAVAGNGGVSLTLVPESSDGLVFHSREGSNPPELVVDYEAGPDTTPPETFIDVGPPAATTSTSATFEFSSSEAGSTFECQLDGGGWAACVSPETYTSLSEAQHTFEVRATDGSGNTDQTPASAVWTVDLTAPRVVATDPADGATDVGLSQVVTATFDEAMDGTSLTSATFTLTLAGGSAIAATVSYDGPSQTASLTPSAALSPETVYSASVVGATDEAGNAVLSAGWTFTTAEAPTQQVFTPTADSYVDANRATTNFGSAATLVSDGGNSPREALLQFDASGIGTVQSATLRIYVTNGSGNGPELALSETGWTEGGVVWDTRPALISGVIADAQVVPAGGWYEFDVTTAITGGGVYSFTLSSISTDAVKFDSREGSNPPELVVDYEAGPDTTPPETFIDVGPPAATTSTSATFEFSSSEAGSTFECQLDGGGWAACVSPETYTSLSEAQHTFEVRATDGSGNTDQTPASAVWTVDLTAPRVVATDPADGATDVGLSQVVTATFDEAMDGTSLTSATFTLTLAGGSAIAATVSYDGPSQTASLTPSAALSPETVYSASVVGATDEAGNAVLSAGWTFTTAEAPTQQVFTPTADSYVDANRATTNFGSAATLVSDGGNSPREALLQFDASGIGTVQSATLRIYVTNGSGNGPELALSETGWTEGGVVWDTRPALISGVIADAQVVPAGGWYEFDVTTAITGGGVYSFTLSSISTDAVKFDSREGSNPPELVVDYEAGPDTTPPETFIDVGPPAATTSTSATFEFSSSEAGSTFECQLDGGGWAACVSPETYTSLSEAQHTFEVRATDGSGNTDQTPASAVWTVDLTAPRVVATDPADGATDVGLSQVVTATFDEAMDGTSLTSATFTLTLAGGSAIAATVSYDGPSQTASLTPSAALSPETVYSASVVGATDEAGNAVLSAGWTFTTAEAPTQQVFTPTADSYVDANRATTNFGSAATLVSDGGNSPREALLQFDASGIGTVQSATLRIYVTNGSGNGPELALSETGWTEGGVVWDTRPALISGVIADAQVVPAGGWYEFDVTTAITGGGVYSFTLSSISTDAVKFDSREGSSPPELVIETP